MKSTVCAQEPESNPAFIDPRWGLSFEAADIAAPGREGCKTERQSTAKGLAKRSRCRLAVATPTEGEALSSGTCSAGEEHCFIFAVTFLQRLIDKFVIYEGVIVVHTARVYIFVMPDHIFCRSPLAKVGLDAIDSQV